MIGLQNQCNTHEQILSAQKKNIHLLTWDEIALSGESAFQMTLRFLSPWLTKNTPLCIGINMSVFSNVFAPGCSRNYATGFSAQDFLILIEVLKARCQIAVTGIYDISISLDVEHRTAALAALIMHRLI